MSEKYSLWMKEKRFFLNLYHNYIFYSFNLIKRGPTLCFMKCEWETFHGGRRERENKNLFVIIALKHVIATKTIRGQTFFGRHKFS